jgi:hypothetical protein
MPPLKSTNVPKPRGERAASLLINNGPPGARIMFGPMKEPTDSGEVPTGIVLSTVLLRVEISDTELLAEFEIYSNPPSGFRSFMSEERC